MKIYYVNIFHYIILVSIFDYIQWNFIIILYTKLYTKKIFRIYTIKFGWNSIRLISFKSDWIGHNMINLVFGECRNALFLTYKQKILLIFKK